MMLFKYNRRFINFSLLLLLCYFKGSFSIYAQCELSQVQWLEKLSALEESDIRVAQKIKLGEDLQQAYLRCTNKIDSIYARIIHRLGSFYSEEGDLKKAIAYTRKAISVNKQAGSASEKEYLANSYFNLGVYYNYLSLFPQSIEYFDSVIVIAKDFPQKDFLALIALQQKSYSFFLMGDYKKSIEIAENGILLSDKSDDPLGAAILLIQKTQSELYLDQLTAAEKNINLAIETLSGADLSEEYLASAYHVYARIMIKKNQYKKAVLFYQKSLEINKAIENWYQYIADLLDLGALYANELNMPKKASEIYFKAIQYNAFSNDNYQILGVYNNMGQLHWKLKDYEKSLFYYQKGLNSMPINFDDTSIYSNPSLDQLKLVAHDNFIRVVLRNKGESFLDLYKRNKDRKFLEFALNAHKAADFMIDRMRQKQLKEESKAYWREVSHEVYKNAIETCYLLNDPLNAFFFFEKSRAVLLSDKLKELNAKNFLSAEDQIKEQEQRLKIFNLQQRLATLKTTTAEFSEMQKQLFETQEVFENYIKTLEKTNPLYYEYKYKTSVPSLKEVQSTLSQGSRSLVEYFTTDEYVYVLTISPGSAAIDRIEINNFNELTMEMNKLCSSKADLNQNYPRYIELANLLYKNLFSPLEISSKKVIISPDEHFVPFELLLSDPNDASSFLLRDYIFSYTYSASTLLNKNNTTAGKISNFLGIAPVEFQPHLEKPSLYGADKSLIKISAYFSASNLLIQKAATKRDFLHNLPSYSVVHLYSHVEADTSGEEPLLYFFDSAMHVNELQSISDLKTRLIILMACKTGVGKLVKGEGIFSLSRSFAAAGIPTTITNLWEVENYPSYQLTELFYKYLNEGFEFDEALQKAKMEFLETGDKEQQLPFHWASTIIIGKSAAYKEKVNAQSINLSIIGFAIFSFIILSFLMWRFRLKIFY